MSYKRRIVFILVTSQLTTISHFLKLIQLVQHLLLQEEAMVVNVSTKIRWSPIFPNFEFRVPPSQISPTESPFSPISISTKIVNSHFQQISDFGHIYSVIYLIFIFQKKNVFISYVLSASKVFPKTTLKKKIDCPTLVPLLEPKCTLILPQDIFHVKRPKLSENQEGDFCNCKTPVSYIQSCVDDSIIRMTNSAEI